jgi:hypothetical protein
MYFLHLETGVFPIILTLNQTQKVSISISSLRKTQSHLLYWFLNHGYIAATQRAREVQFSRKLQHKIFIFINIIQPLAAGVYRRFFLLLCSAGIF